MAHKFHLQHTTHRGPTCQTGRIGSALRGEHFTEGFEEFAARHSDRQCSRCVASKLFAFLQRKEADKWEPEHPDAWKQADDRLVAAIN